MMDYNRNSSIGFIPKPIATLSAHPWLIVFIGNRVSEDTINSILRRAHVLSERDDCNIAAYDIPEPTFLPPLDVIDYIDSLDGTDLDVWKRFCSYVIKPIQETHDSMLPGTKVAVIFDRRDFKHSGIFRRLVKAIPFFPVCTTVDFPDERSCEKAVCSICGENDACLHNCLDRLFCNLFDKSELPAELFQ
jgi:hypothetical protein